MTLSHVIGGIRVPLGMAAQAPSLPQPRKSTTTPLMPGSLEWELAGRWEDVEIVHLSNPVPPTKTYRRLPGRAGGPGRLRLAE